jgi:hypothetical protein
MHTSILLYVIKEIKMLVQATQSKFMFYTYNKLGYDIVVTIIAKNQDTAWEEFDKAYGTDMPVDKVTEVATA